MPDVEKIFLILASVFLLEALLYNFITPNLPKIPGDIFLDKTGFRLYIPFVSALVLSAALSFLLNYLG